MKFKWLTKNLPKMVGGLLNFIGIFFPNFAAKKALDVFSKPRKGKIKPYHAKYLDTLHQKTLFLDNLAIQTYFIDNKSNITILLAHGWESNAARWKRLIKHLTKLPINIVALDAPAHGKSGSDIFTGEIYGDMINVVVDHYHPQLVIGHSVGAFSIAYYIHKYSKKSLTDFIILASPDSMADIAETYFEIIGLSKKVIKAYYGSFEKWFGNPLSYYSTANYLKDVDINGIIIHDKNDDINEFYNGEAIHKAWKKSTLIPIEGSDHGLQSKKVFSIVTNYLSHYLKQ